MATKTAPKPTVVKQTASAPAPEVKVAPQAPRFRMGPWPKKAQEGNSIRAFCYSVAMKLDKSNPDGFTVRELAVAFAINAKGSDYKQPSAGWGTAEKPSGTAMTHANWFANEKQGWLSPTTDD